MTMYAAEIVKKQVKNNALYVTVQFKNGEDVFEQEFFANSGADPYWLQNLVNGRLYELNQLLIIAEEMKLGPVPVGYGKRDPLPHEIWATDVLMLKQMRAAVDIGVMASDSEEIMAQQEKVKSGFKPEYIETVRLI